MTGSLRDQRRHNRPSVAIVHDYLTQRGGAERVVLAMMSTFPDAELHTSLYDPKSTFPEFRHYDIRTMPLNAIPALRTHHRATIALLAPSFARYEVDADVVICSSSGWAHGVRTSGRKLVYCHSAPRWLYSPKRYLGSHSTRPHRALAWCALTGLRGPLTRWDRKAAHTAARYLVVSRAVQDQVRHIYGINATLLHPPAPDLTQIPPDRGHTSIEPGFLLTVSRLLPYKNVDVVVRAMRHLAADRLVVVGSGPELHRLRSIASANVSLVGTVTDHELAWLYRNCDAVVAPSYEDFGLVPIEAAAFGKLTAALAYGGFLDTIIDGHTGVLFPSPDPPSVVQAVRRLRSIAVDPHLLTRHARSFSDAAFGSGLQSHVAHAQESTST